MEVNVIYLYELEGDYDLKVMRQEYYINRQKAVLLAASLHKYVTSLNVKPYKRIICTM